MLRERARLSNVKKRRGEMPEKVEMINGYLSVSVFICPKKRTRVANFTLMLSSHRSRRSNSASQRLLFCRHCHHHHRCIILLASFPLFRAVLIFLSSLTEESSLVNPSSPYQIHNNLLRRRPASLIILERASFVS